MKASLEFMLVLFLLMLFFGVSESVVDYSDESVEAEQLCQIVENSAIDCDSTFAQSLSVDSKSRSLAVSDIEPSIRLVESSSSFNYRLRRIIESNDSFKGLMYKFFLSRESAFLLDQSKSYRSDQYPHHSIISSDYYVFALRHILI